MKKIALFLAFALAMTAVNAQEVYWGGWLETKANSTQETGTKDGTELKDDAAKAKHNFGATTLDLELHVVADTFGAEAVLETWSGDTSFAAPTFLNTYVWSKFNDNFTLYGGIGMYPISYAPAPLMEGGFLFNDQFGRGMGEYNYRGDGSYTKGINGVIGEVTVDAFSAALVFKAPETNGSLQEDEFKNNMIFNAKYDHEMVTAYAGFAVREDLTGDDLIAEATAVATKLADEWGAADLAEFYSWGGAAAVADAMNGAYGNALWVAASIKAVQFLTAEIKYETNLASEDFMKKDMIALNLGYEMEVVKAATEINYWMVNVGDAEDTGMNGWSVQLQITPLVIPVVDVNINATFGNTDAKDAGMDYGIGFDVSKSIGNVTNKLELAYSSNGEEDPLNTLQMGYAINIWF